MTKQSKLPLSDSDQYARMRKPFESSEELSKAVIAFNDELYELRNKYGIADVLFAIQDSVAGEGVVLTHGHIGSEREGEAMAAWLFGRVQGDRQELVRRSMELGSRRSILKPDSGVER